jgi:hypothetical protein
MALSEGTIAILILIVILILIYGRRTDYDYDYDYDYDRTIFRMTPNLFTKSVSIVVKGRACFGTRVT